MHRPLAAHENLDGAMCRKEIRTLSQALTLRYDKVLFILDPTGSRQGAWPARRSLSATIPMAVSRSRTRATSLPYRTFDTLRSVHRSEVVENKRLDDVLALVAEMQAGREQQRSKRGPRRTGQTDHMFGIRDGSQSNGYQKRGTTPGRKTDFTNDPVVIALAAASPCAAESGGVIGVSKLKFILALKPSAADRPAQPRPAPAGRRHASAYSLNISTCKRSNKE